MHFTSRYGRLPVSRLAAASVAALLVGACASIIHGTHQDVGISSNPTAAHVTVDGQQTGTTPVVAHLTRKDNHIVRLELPGYKPYEATLTRGVSGWDSNPRGSCEPSGFQDRCIQPLCHLSAVDAVARLSFYQAADTDPVRGPTASGAVSRRVP